MTLATDPLIQQRQFTFDEFLACYGSDKRYELIDGEVFDLEPTGQHEEVAAFITTSICALVDGEYDIQLLRGDRPITSLTFPDLNLTAKQVLRAGQ